MRLSCKKKDSTLKTVHQIYTEPESTEQNTADNVIAQNIFGAARFSSTTFVREVFYDYATSFRHKIRTEIANATTLQSVVECK